MKKNAGSIEYADLQRMLSAVFTLCLLNDGLAWPKLEELISRARKDADRKIRTLNPSRFSAVDLVLLGSILHRWNRNPNYLDHEARPFPIKAAGRAPSIEALFRAENVPSAFEAGFRHLRRARLVRRTRTGLYLPGRDLILVHTLSPEMVANLALSIDRLVTTLLQNTSTKRRVSSRLIERTALVPDLPKRFLSEFKSFSREQGGALISTMNDWLETRRLAKSPRGSRARKESVSAGIHVFAFAEKNS